MLRPMLAKKVRPDETSPKDSGASLLFTLFGKLMTLVNTTVNSSLEQLRRSSVLEFDPMKLLFTGNKG